MTRDQAAFLDVCQALVDGHHFQGRHNLKVRQERKSEKIKNLRTDAKSIRKTPSKENPSMVPNGGLTRILETVLEADYFDRVLCDNTRRGELKKILVRILKIASEQGIRPLMSQAFEKISRREFRIMGPSIPDSTYARWIAKNEPTEIELNKQRIRGKQFRYRPLISIVTPVWNPPLNMLSDAVESVLAQTYEKWELCIADGGSIPLVRDVLYRFASHDRRVKVRFLEKNLGISRNSNEAIEESRGEFIAFLDHDDLLAPFAMFEVVDYLNKDRDLDFIYSDRDCATASGKRFDPFFKPDWSPELMLSADYVTHLCVVRSALLKSIGGLRPETDGAQDWDLFLRVAETTDRICHIPKILYHWRQAPASVSSAGLRYAKPYAAKAQLMAVGDHLARTGRKASVRFDGWGNPRIDWLLTEQPRVSIVICCLETDPLLRLCLRSVFDKSAYPDFEVIVVCAGGISKSFREGFPNVSFLRCGDQLGQSSPNNQGAAHSTGSVLVFLDPTIEVVSGNWLQELVGWAMQPEIGAVGAKLLESAGRIFHGGLVIGLPGYIFSGAREHSWFVNGYTEWYRDWSAVSGSCLATRRNVFEEVGPFDEKNHVRADIEFCLRARKRNYRVVYTPYARLLLHRSTDRLQYLLDSSQTSQTDDLYFNPNLSHQHAIPTVKTP